jgi:hypothetical protein
VERIGKKYQWIAYWELVGYLADYHWYLSWDEPVRILDRIDPFDRLDIDASFLLAENATFSDGRVPSLSLPTTDFQGTTAEKDREWTGTLDDIPDLPDVVEVADPFGRNWWMVHAFRRDANYMDKLQSEAPMRTGQVWFNLVIMRQGEASKLLAQMRNGPLHHRLFDRRDSIDHLFGEYAADFLEERPAEQCLSDDVAGSEFSHAAARVNPNRGGYDLSGAREGFSGPAELVLHALNLIPESPWSPIYVTPSGVVGFFDADVNRDESLASFVNADLLAAWLQKNGLEPVWVMGAEKDGGMGHGPGLNWDPNSSRRVFGGIWWKTADGWVGEKWISPDQH